MYMSKPIYWGIEILEERGTAKYRVQAPTGQPSQPSQLSQSNQPVTTITTTHHQGWCGGSWSPSPCNEKGGGEIGGMPEGGLSGRAYPAQGSAKLGIQRKAGHPGQGWASSARLSIQRKAGHPAQGLASGTTPWLP